MVSRFGYWVLFFLFCVTRIFAQNTDSAIQVIQQIKNDTERLKTLNSYARNIQAEHPKNAISVYEALAADAGKSGQKYYAALACSAMGHIYYETFQDYAHSLQYLLQALQLQKELKLNRDEVLTLMSIAYVYDYAGDMDKEKSYAQEANRVCGQYKVYSMQAHVLNLLATIDTKQGRLDTAIKVYRQSIAIATSQKDTGAQIQSLCNLATALKKNKQYEASLAAYIQTINLVDTSKDFYSYGVIIGEMALLFYDMGDLQRSEQYAMKSIALEPKADEISILAEMYKLLKDIYASEKKYPEALDYFAKWMAVKDSILNIGKAVQLKELETKYDTKVKNERILSQNKQIANNRKMNFFLGLVSLLFITIGTIVYRNQQNTAQLNKLVTNQKKEVESLNEVKDKIFSVIAHDMRSPVNSLITFTDLLESGDIPPDELSTYARMLKNNLVYTAGLMDNLLNWARTQMHGYTPVRENFDIAATIQNVVGLMNNEAKNKGVQVLNEVENNTIVFADINMTALIIRNLLGNAIKYTGNGGTITISARSVAGKTSILVQDTGKGMKPEKVASLNSIETQPLDSTPGTENEKGTGLGLMLCKSFVVLMKGSITVESEIGKGSCFIVELPAYN